jgi:hypothetical protein
MNPLGVRDDFEMTDEMLQRLIALENFDLHRVTNRIQEKALLPESWIEEATLEFRRFLSLKVLFNEPVGMISPYVDEVWHQTILFTHLYIELGHQIGSGYIHHEPNDGDDASVIDPGIEDGGEAFRRMYGDAYGDLPAFWSLHIAPVAA